MKSRLVHAVFGLFMLVFFTSSVNATWLKTNWTTSNNYFKLYSSQNKVLAQTWDTINGGRLLSTSTGGTSWAQVAAADSSYIDVLSAAIVGNNVVVGTWNGLYKTTFGSKTWTAATPAGMQMPTDSTIVSLSLIGSSLFAGGMGEIYRSADSGTSWVEVKSGIAANARINSFAGSGTTIFAGSDSAGVFVTTNNGTSWTALNTGLTNLHIVQLAIMGTKVFAVTFKGVFVTRLNGTSWSAATMPANQIVNCLVAAKNQLIAGTDTLGTFLSTDSGATWTRTNAGLPYGTRVWSLAAASGDTVYAGTSAGVYLTTTTLITSAKNSAPALSSAKGMSLKKQNGSLTAIEFSLANPEMVSITLFDLRGNKVKSLVHEKCSAGSQSFPFEAGAIARGSYIVRLTAGRTVYQQIVPILK